VNLTVSPTLMVICAGENVSIGVVVPPP